MARFAMGGARLLNALKEILPQTKTEWALRLGPEAGFAVLSAAMAPEGTDPLQRLGIGAEDATIGLLSSFGGSGLGRLVGGRFVPRGSFSNEERLKRLSPYLTGGDILAAPAQMFAPRPMYQSVLEGYSEREQERLMAEEEQRRTQEALATSTLTGSGALLAPGLGAAFF